MCCDLWSPGTAADFAERFMYPNLFMDIDHYQQILRVENGNPGVFLSKHAFSVFPFQKSVL